MQVGDVIRIDMPENGIWDGKRGKIEAIDDEKGIATVLVNFIPSENKNVRQDFNLKNLASIEEESLQEDEDDIDLRNDEINYGNHIREELAQFFDVDLEDVTQEDDHRFVVNGDTYWVGTYDEAYEEAVEHSRELLDEMGLEALTPDYRDYVIENYLDKDEMEDIMREYYEGYVDDIEDEDDDTFPNRLVQEMYDAGILTDDYFEKDEDGEIDYSTLSDEDGAIDWESKKEAFVDHLIETDDAYSFLESMFGNGPELSKFVEENNLIDFDEVAEDCVDTDGIAHFLSYYDGKELEIRDDLFAYRQD